MKNKNNLEKYAKLLVHYGLKLKKDDRLIIDFDRYCIDLVELITKEAYQKGVSDIKYEFSDTKINNLRYIFGSENAYTTYNQIDVDYKNKLIDEKYNMLHLTNYTKPDKRIDIEKSSTYNQLKGKLLNEYSSRIMSNEIRWVIAPIVSDDWAELMYPEDELEIAKNKLWGDLFTIVRVDKEDPIKECNIHNDNLKNRLNILNNMNIKYLHFEDENTDLYVGLAKEHIWRGGEEYSKDGDIFMANIPTEEVYTMPHKYNVNGYVKVTKPFVIYGKKINNLKMYFEKGRLIDFIVDENKDVFQKLINTDKGARYLGEVALVDKSSPINKFDNAFFETLIDENATCHIALGAAYSDTTSSNDDKEEIGFNESSIHNDFMIGSDTMKVIAVTEKEAIDIIVNGKFTI